YIAREKQHELVFRRVVEYVELVDDDNDQDHQMSPVTKTESQAESETSGDTDDEMSNDTSDESDEEINNEMNEDIDD
ncbi:unnamed protein product, partial [Rotaria sp. Silwood1]